MSQISIQTISGTKKRESETNFCVFLNPRKPKHGMIVHVYRTKASMLRQVNRGMSGKLKDYSAKALCLSYENRKLRLIADLCFYSSNITPGVIAHEALHGILSYCRTHKFDFKVIAKTGNIFVSDGEEWICCRLGRVVNQIHEGLKKAGFLS